MSAEQAWPWVLRIGGFLGVIHETVISDFDRPALLALFALMMGLSDFLDARSGKGK